MRKCLFTPTDGDCRSFSLPVNSRPYHSYPTG